MHVVVFQRSHQLEVVTAKFDDSASGLRGRILRWLVCSIMPALAVGTKRSGQAVGGMGTHGGVDEGVGGLDWGECVSANHNYFN